jgi:3-hydroxyisobutyrate dehydrogenase-like beta-hydroxyacid dehydrogenase
MGSAVASRLLDAGFEIWVHNRSPQKANELLTRGAHWAATPRDVARAVELVITMVAEDEALQHVVCGAEGVLSGIVQNLTLMDMSTVSPTASSEVAAACHEAAVPYLRAPVSGSTVLASTGSLSVLVSGPQDSFGTWRDVLEKLASSVLYVGGGEEARTMKLMLNMVVSATMLAMGEALVLGERNGLDWQTMLDVFCNSAVASPLVKYKSDLLARRDFSPAFTTAMMVKDLDLALALARQLGVVAPTTALGRELLQTTVGLGWGEHDFAAVVRMLEQVSEASTPANR